MTESNKKKKLKDPDLKHFNSLKPYMEKVAIGGLGRNQVFSICVKASIVKCFEYNLFVRRESNTINAFFYLPTLRSVCEDLIVLNYIKGMPLNDREEIIQHLMHYGTHSKIKTQCQFFSEVRPQQPVLTVRDADTTISQAERRIRLIWNRYGWPNLKQGTMPQLRQIAEKQEETVLVSLYDYLYRLTSSAVHFDVQSLLRSGWGPTKKECSFSTSNFHNYFDAYASIYGAFLFCVYFEFFGRQLRPGREIKKTISEIRKSILMKPRWPEMVTFEEMNLEVPEPSPIQHMISFVQSKKHTRLMDLNSEK